MQGCKTICGSMPNFLIAAINIAAAFRHRPREDCMSASPYACSQGTPAGHSLSDKYSRKQQRQPRLKIHPHQQFHGAIVIFGSNSCIQEQVASSGDQFAFHKQCLPDGTYRLQHSQRHVVLQQFQSILEGLDGC